MMKFKNANQRKAVMAKIRSGMRVNVKGTNDFGKVLGVDRETSFGHKEFTVKLENPERFHVIEEKQLQPATKAQSISTGIKSEEYLGQKIFFKKLPDGIMAQVARKDGTWSWVGEGKTKKQAMSRAKYNLQIAEHIRRIGMRSRK